VVWAFVLITVVWGIVTFRVGLLIALQLVLPVLNLNLPITTFGRLRPLHTNAAIFAFAGNAVFATQGLMWRAIDARGNLSYPDFVETSGVRGPSQRHTKQILPGRSNTFARPCGKGRW